jgi:cytochrome d ubiquinol oxidase subunit II
VDVAAAVLLLIGICAYAVFGGADFGGGFWDLFAGGAKRGARVRALIERSTGPVWEPNHIWLVFIFVVAWTAFPPAFAAIGTTLYVAVFIAGLGIIFRGAAFAFREAAVGMRQRRMFGALYASSSIITPFFFGAMIGAIASGEVPAGGNPDSPFSSWLGLTSILGGVMGVVVTAYLGAAYLGADADRSGESELASYFRARAIAAGIAAGIVAIGGIFVLRENAPTLYDGLIAARGLPFVILSATAGIGTLALLWQRRLQLARISGAAAVVLVIVGWGFAQFPWILVDNLTLSDAAGATVTLVSVVATVAVALLILVPSLFYLYRLMMRGVFDTPLEAGWERGEDKPLSAPQQAMKTWALPMPKRAMSIAVALLFAGVILLESEGGPAKVTFVIGIVAFVVYFVFALASNLTPARLGEDGPDWNPPDPESKG